MKNNICIKEKRIVLIVILSVMFALLVLTGSLTSGYHLVDDHGLYYIQDKINRVGMSETLRSSIVSDFGIRFRPLYMIEQVLGTAVFGTHMFLWNFYKLCQGIVTAYLLYLVARHLKLSVWWASIFTIVIIMGPQFRCWNRAANQENTGALLCALSLFFLVRSYLSDWRKVLWRALFIMAVISMSLMKESFVILLPAFYLFEVCLGEECITEGSGLNISRLFEPLIKHAPSWVLIALCCITEVFVIVRYVGTNSIGYAGFSKDTKLNVYVNGIIGSIVDQLKYGIILIVLAVALLIYLYYVYNIELTSVMSKFLLFMYIFCSQLVLYAKSGMEERYLMPWVVSIAVLCIWAVGSFEEKINGDLWYHDYKVAVLAYAFIAVVISIGGSFSWAKEAPTGANGFLTQISKYSHEGDSVAIYGMEGEHLDSSITWLTHRGMIIYDTSTSEEIDDTISADTILVKGTASLSNPQLEYKLQSDYYYVWVDDEYTIWRLAE